MARPRTISDDRLLDAAARVVAQRGPIAFTLAEVAREADVSAPLLVQRYGTKRGLLVTLAASLADRVEQTFDAARRAHASPLTALESALVALAGNASPREVANGLAFLQLDVLDPELRAEALAWFDSFRREVAALVADAREAGELRGGEPDALAGLVEMAYNGSTLMWAIRQEGPLAHAVRCGLGAVLAPYRPVTPSPSSTLAGTT